MAAKYKMLKAESGQAMVIFALVFVVLCGLAAFTLDVGRAHIVKGHLQNAADAAALAASQDLPNTSAAIATAVSYAELNGVQGSDITVTCPYNGDSKQIKVVCAETVEYSFARVIGFTSTEVSAIAIGSVDFQWAGEALPFINLDDDYEVTTEIVAWEKVSPGDFESISNYEIMNEGDPDTLYFKIDYMNGVTLKKGTVATIKQEVGYVFDQHYPDSPVYVLSLSSAVMNSGKVLLTDGTNQDLNKLKNGDVVDPSQLVLLKCIFHDYDYKGKTLFFSVLDVYNIGNGEFPPEYVSPDGGTVKLVG